MPPRKDFGIREGDAIGHLIACEPVEVTRGPTRRVFLCTLCGRKKARSVSHILYQLRKGSGLCVCRSLAALAAKPRLDPEEVKRRRKERGRMQGKYLTGIHTKHTRGYATQARPAKDERAEPFPWPRLNRPSRREVRNWHDDEDDPAFENCVRNLEESSCL